MYNIYIYIYIYIYIRGAFNKFPDFFVQAFKFVVDTWKFSTFLLYILWDDWPIFMISGSNEQLQQEFKYTLLKPDCHSWWISKMQWGHSEEQYAIKFCFKLGKNATETYGMLQTAFQLSCMNQASVFEWHKRFKQSRESVRDDERCGRSKEVNTPELMGQRVRARVKVNTKKSLETYLMILIYIYIYIYIYNSLNTLSGAKSCLAAPGVAVLPWATETVLSPLVGSWWGQGIARAFTRCMMKKNIYITFSKWKLIISRRFNCFFSFLHRFRWIFPEMILLLEDIPLKEEYAS